MAFGAMGALWVRGPYRCYINLTLLKAAPIAALYSSTPAFIRKRSFGFEINDLGVESNNRLTPCH